jgi:hypothetical protein
VNAGKQIAITAFLRNVMGRGKKRLLFVVEGENGEIDPVKGIFKAPITRDAKQETIKISCLDDLTIRPATANVEILPAPIPSIIASSDQKIKAGKRLQVNAFLKDWLGVGEKPRLVYELASGTGDVDEKGSYLAPLVMKNQKMEIKISCPEDQVVVSKTVIITVEGAKPIYPRFVKILAGQELPFRTKSEFNITPRWEIENLCYSSGNINPDTGVYKAPELIKEERSTVIKMKDLNTGKEDSIKVKLLPVWFACENNENIYAGQEKVQLNIKVRNDMAGIKNFSCRIISGPGDVEDGGIYFPPQRIDKKPTKIVVEAVSRLDPSKKIRHEFEIGFPLCVKCKTETVNGICPNCPPEKSFSEYFNDFKERMK